MTTASILAIVILCLTHIFAGKLKLSNIPRSKWLSLAGGISVSYIFLATLPEMAEYQEEQEIFSKVDNFIYYISLAGLVFFYGLENKTKKSQESKREPAGGEEEDVPGIFWLHISSFALYNFIIGYLVMNRKENSLEALLLYSIAMAFHFIVTDHSLVDHFGRQYQKKGRWILVLLLLLGWFVPHFYEISEAVIIVLFSFLAGGIIMNVLKEELPKERKSNLSFFLLGIFLYSILLSFA